MSAERSVGKPDAIKIKKGTKELPEEDKSKQEEILVNARHQFVLKALQTKASQGDPKNYNLLVAQLSESKDPMAVQRWYIALAKCSSYIQPDFEALTSAFWKFDWLSPLPTVVAYCSFLINLVSSTGQFLKQTLQTLVRSFICIRVSPAVKNEPDVDSVTEQMHSCVHQTLFRIMKLILTAPTRLYPELAAQYPHPRRDVGEQQMYVKNLLRVTESVPVLRDRILKLIVGQLILLDVEVRDQDADIEEAEEEKVEEEEDEGLVFVLEDGKEDEGKTANTTANKLDTLICLLMRYFKLIEDEAADTLLGDEVFNSFLVVFQEAILPTHKSRFVQYLLFYACSRKHHYAEMFLRRLLITMESPVKMEKLRRHCAVYIGSFVSRAKTLRRVTVVAAFSQLLNFTLKLEADLVAKGAGSNPGRTAPGRATSNPRPPVAGGPIPLRPAAAAQDSAEVTLVGLFHLCCRSCFQILQYRPWLLSADHNDWQRSTQAQTHATLQQPAAPDLGPVLRLVRSPLMPLARCGEDLSGTFVELLVDSQRRRGQHTPSSLKLQQELHNLLLDAAQSAHARRRRSRPKKQQPKTKFQPFAPYRLKKSAEHFIKDIYLWTPEEGVHTPFLARDQSGLTPHKNAIQEGFDFPSETVELETAIDNTHITDDSAPSSYASGHEGYSFADQHMSTSVPGSFQPSPALAFTSSDSHMVVGSFVDDSQRMGSLDLPSALSGHMQSIPMGHSNTSQSLSQSLSHSDL
eukprot:g67088.t1